MSLGSYLGTAKAAVIEVVASLDAAVIAAVIVVASLVSLGQITGDTGIYWAAITRCLRVAVAVTGLVGLLHSTVCRKAVCRTMCS